MLKVIGAGLPRTGTTSLKHALNQLGFGPCDHMMELVGEPHRWPLWYRFERGEHGVATALFDGYASAVDNPTCCFWEPLSAVFPDAKVILTTRPAADWYDSYARTLLDFEKRPAPNAAFAELTAFLTRVWVDGMMAGQLHDPDAAMALYDAHIARVKSVVCPERLLMFDAQDGWEPLCAFLDVPVPATPYPRKNTGDHIAKTGQHER
jgi:hypothetical protein